MQLSKTQARQLEEVCETVTSAAAVAGTGSALIAAVTGGVAAVPVAAGLFVGAVSTGLGKKAGRIAEDPPRRDYDASTRLWVPRVRAEGIARRAALTGEELDQLSRVLMSLGDIEVTVTGYLGAHLRAYERLLGAVEFGASRFAEARAAEAERYARGAAKELERLTEAATGAARLIQAQESEPHSIPARTRDVIAEAPVTRQRPISEFLPDSVMAMLYESGVPIGALRRRVRPIGDPWRTLREQLVSLASASEELATTLRGWSADPAQ